MGKTLENRLVNSIAKAGIVSLLAYTMTPIITSNSVQGYLGKLKDPEPTWVVVSLVVGAYCFASNYWGPDKKTK